MTLPPDERKGRVAGALLLAIATLAALVLSLRHLLAFALPGCGIESGCERAFASAWATLPVLEWPVAFVGVSWFAALLAAWLASGGGWQRALVWLVRLGALVSLVLVVAMLVESSFCNYCALVHASNFGFLVASERRGGGGRLLAPLAAFAGVLVASSAVLAYSSAQRRGAVLARDERDLERSKREILEAGERRAFTGRFRLGPQEAPIRIVVFSDYQCRECMLIESELAALLARRSDVSLSAKHFPLCSDCNRRARELGQNPHPNACWAARAAEAAGIVAGDDGFWRMHRWLFERGGDFDEHELAEGLASMGLPQEAFLSALHGPETLARVEADVAEALELGIHTTPLIFLNGVELRGWNAPNALARAVDELVQQHPAPGNGAGDAPPSALTKFMEDWRAQPEVMIPQAGRESARPGISPHADVVLYGDYADANTRELDRRVRAALEDRGAAYSFRAYPLDGACGPGLLDRNPGACLLARAAQAAWTCGGDDAFRRMHAWLMEEARAPDARLLASAAQRLGLDPRAFARELDAPSTYAAIRTDVDRARALGVGAIPALYVGGRLVPRWNLEGERVPELVIEEALTR